MNGIELPALWAFVSSGDYTAAVRRIDHSLKVSNGAMTQVPFDFEDWTKVAAEKTAEAVADDPFSFLPLVAAGAVAGTSILGAVIFWRRRRRRKSGDEAETAPNDLETEADDA